MFTPSPESIAKARAIVAAFEAAPNAGVIGLNGEMLDQPNLTKARRLLAGYGET
jgi:citrate lyase subunit beta/citryl-CoA lyase